MPLIEHRPNPRCRPDCNWLLSHGRNITSQTGVDGIVETIFKLIGTTSKFCVEFGAWDGKYLSNTYNLLKNENWSGILVEADHKKCEEIRVNHPDPRVRIAHQLLTWEGVTSFDATMTRLDAPRSIDFVSIDVDGNDYHIWKAIEAYRPRLIVIEVNPTIPNDVYFVQDADLAVNHGSSLLAMIELGKAKGYSLVCVSSHDAFFVLDELFPLFKIPDNSIDAMYGNDLYQLRLVQCFDGTLFTAGYRRLIWADVSFEYDELQLLPKERRVMPGNPGPPPPKEARQS